MNEPTIRDEEMDELVKLFRAGHVAVPARATPDERVRAGLAVALVASGYRREADVLREAAEAYAAQWRSAARLGQAVDLPPTQASFVAWLEVRATALEQAQPLLAARFEPEPDGGRVEYGAAHDTCEHWGSWPTAESLIAWLPDNPGWRPLIRVTSGVGLALPLPLPPFDGTVEREHPGHDVPTVGVPMAADGVERDVIDMGWLSLPAEIQAEAEQAISAGTPQPLLVPTGPPRDPHAATVPFEAFVGDHPDHIDWVRDTGRCMASGPHECVTGASVEGQERSEEND